MLVSEIPTDEYEVTSAVARSNLRIITADDLNPRERDDGISVLPLRTKPDNFRVAVCIADPSAAYYRDDVYKQALEKTEASYWLNPDGSRGYEPMISPDIIRKHEFTKGAKLSALIVSFTVGPETAPSETEIDFGDVEVVSNLNFRNFAERCQHSKGVKRYGKASQLIKQHLAYNSGLESYQDAAGAALVSPAGQLIMHGPGETIRLRGSRINEAFMIAAGYLVGRELKQQDMPAIYRVHNPEDKRFQDMLPVNMAMYSLKPGRHDGLNLDVYCRVTSPLRRGTDLVMGHVLKKMSMGQSISLRDVRDMEVIVQRSNLKILAAEAERKFRLPKPGLGRVAVRTATAVA